MDQKLFMELPTPKFLVLSQKEFCFWCKWVEQYRSLKK